MHRIKKSLSCLFLLGSALASAQYTDQINSNRPGESMSAFAVGQTVFQVESGLYGIHENHSVLDYDANGFGLDAQVRYGMFLEELEIVADLQYQYDWYSDALQTNNRNGFRQLVIGGKWLVYDPDKNYKPEVNIYSWKANHKFNWHSFIPAVAVYVGANIVGKENPYTFNGDGLSPKVMAILHNNFGKFVWVNNIIADKVTTDYPSYGIISTLTRGFNAEWSGFLELQGYKSDYYSDAILRIGAAHLLNDSMQIDASISKNYKDSPNILYGGIGFSWRFDLDYRDILLAGESEVEKSQSEADKKKAKKDKEDKERLDEITPEGTEQP